MVSGAAERLGQAAALSLGYLGANVFFHSMRSTDVAGQTPEHIRKEEPTGGLPPLWDGYRRHITC